jgi:hypothetical protein
MTALNGSRVLGRDFDFVVVCVQSRGFAAVSAGVMWRGSTRLRRLALRCGGPREKRPPSPIGLARDDHDAAQPSPADGPLHIALRGHPALVSTS